MPRPTASDFRFVSIDQCGTGRRMAVTGMGYRLAASLPPRRGNQGRAEPRDVSESEAIWPESDSVDEELALPLLRLWQLSGAAAGLRWLERAAARRSRLLVRIERRCVPVICQATVLCVLTAFGSSVALYWAKARTGRLDREIVHVAQATQDAQAQTTRLKTEWVALNAPDRLQDLASRHSSLVPIEPAQFVEPGRLDERLAKVSETAPAPNVEPSAPPGPAPSLTPLPPASSSPSSQPPHVQAQVQAQEAAPQPETVEPEQASPAPAVAEKAADAPPPASTQPAVAQPSPAAPADAELPAFASAEPAHPAPAPRQLAADDDEPRHVIAKPLHAAPAMMHFAAPVVRAVSAMVRMAPPHPAPVAPASQRLPAAREFATHEAASREPGHARAPQQAEAARPHEMASRPELPRWLTQARAVRPAALIMSEPPHALTLPEAAPAKAPAVAAAPQPHPTSHVALVDRPAANRFAPRPSEDDDAEVPQPAPRYRAPAYPGPRYYSGYGYGYAQPRPYYGSPYGGYYGGYYTPPAYMQPYGQYAQ